MLGISVALAAVPYNSPHLKGAHGPDSFRMKFVNYL